MRRVLAWLFIVAGVALAVAGLRILYLSHRAQSEAANEWLSQPAGRPIYRPGDLIGRLRIPRLDADWFLFEGSSDSVLEKGPGRLEGTAVPGSAGNCVIAGHRDTHFRPLRNIQEGDEILVESHGQTYRYRVFQKRVVYPTNTKMLQPESEGTLTLVTCFPFYFVGPAPKRFIVQAELLKEPDAAGKVNDGQTARIPASKPG